MFLDGHIGEVNKHVVQFTGAGCVLDCAEPTEAELVPEDQTTERVQRVLPQTIIVIIHSAAIFSIHCFVYNISENSAVTIPQSPS